MKYIYLLFLFCLFGCTRTTNKQSNIKNIYLEQSNIQDFIGLPIQLTTLDSVLFINDFYGDSLIHCISLKDNKPIAKLGVKGSGPNEVLSPLYIFIKEDSLFMFSRPQWTLYNIDLQGGKVKKKITVPMEVSLLFPFQDNFYFCSGMFDDKRFWILNSLGEKVAALGDYPLLWNEEAHIPLAVRRMFHQVRGYGYSRTKGVAVTDSHVLDLYNKNHKGEYILKKEVLLSAYEYDFTDKGISSQTQLRSSFMKGAINLAVTDDYIYILFDVNSQENLKRLNNEIWKFDWEGNLICKYKPNIDISLFTLSSCNNIIGLTNTEEPQIVIWHE